MLKSWLMTLIKQYNNWTQEEKNYNKVHSSTRVIIERAFGRLKSRWRILTGQGIFCRNLNKIILIVYVSYILHNICINNCSERSIGLYVIKT